MRVSGEPDDRRAARDYARGEHWRVAVRLRLRGLWQHVQDDAWCRTHLGALLALVPHCVQTERWDEIIELCILLDSFLDREGEHRHYEALMRQAVDAAQRKGDRRRLAHLCHHLAVLLQRQMRYDEASEYARQAHELKQELVYGD